METNDKKFMKMAIQQARLALKNDKLPVGTVIVAGSKILARGQRGNTRLDHAEIIALREVLDKKHRFPDGMTIYTTLEPCAMCFGAILGSGVHRLVYALEDPYGGASSISRTSMPPRHQIKFPNIIKGVLRKESIDLLRKFFTTTKKKFWQNLSNPLVKLCISK